MDRQATFRIILERPPAGVDYAVQKGKGSSYEMLQKQRSTGADLRFEFSVGVTETQGGPRFTGPLVQGPPAERFIYIDIGTMAGQADTPWSRRLKVHLSGITRKMLDGARVLEARIPGTGRDGGPTCASAWRPDEGPGLWKPVRD
jgi:hypothetical protein